MTFESQIRATFNDTKKAQEKLRELFDYLEQHNSIVKKQAEFFDLLADALLGMEYDKRCKLFLDNAGVIEINNLGKFIRHLGYSDSNMVGKKFFRDYNIVIRDNVPISFLWNKLKFEIFGVYPDALAMSVRISKEQTRYQGSDEVTSYAEVRRNKA